MKIQITVTILLTTAAVSSSLRILGLFPHHAVSHFHFFHPIMVGLAEAGHDVTVVSHFRDENPHSNYKELIIGGQTNLTNVVDLQWFANRHSFDHFLSFLLLHEWGRESCQVAVHSKAMETVFEMKDTFDVILVEQFNSDCMMGVAWQLRAPVIGLSSSAILPYYYHRLGIPLLASHVPISFLGYSDKMTLPQRITNWFSVHVLLLMKRLLMDRSDDAILRQKFGDDMPSVTDISRNISIILVNTHYSLSGPRLLSNKVIEVGGVHIKEPKAIEKKLLQIMDTSEHGIIYVSWGSMIRAETLPAEKREALLKAFGSLKQTVLWKWENETLPNKPDNVHIQKWMPQREILCHPKVRVFLTHGGLLGSSEAAFCGVPVVVTPIYGDQFLNSAALVDRGMGTIVEYEDISVESIENAIQFAVESRTQENAKKVSYSYRNRPQPAIKTAVWWVEHVAATGGAHFTDSQLTLMKWYEYNLLDVYAVVLGGFILFVVSCAWIFKKICGKKKAYKKVKAS